MSSILFISALDFKERSIQVIRKTPEAFRDAGWDVDYIVARDASDSGNYSYEREFNPDEISVERVYWPFPTVRAKSPRLLALIIGKLASLLVILKLAFKAFFAVRNKKYDVIYGYEMHGVIAMNLIRPIMPKGIKLVSRFQGTFLNEMIEKKQFLRLLFNFDLIFAIWSYSDLLIMTDDGTQGNLALSRIRGKRMGKVRFWVNGVDEVNKPLTELKLCDYWVFLAVSRLVSWKRVDRALYVMKELVNKGLNCKLLVVGEGNQKDSLLVLCERLELLPYVEFVGAVEHARVKDYMLASHFFISMYESSNVGNPLLEAIRFNIPVITLNNGDTNKWIEHQKTGLIYDHVNTDFEIVADDVMGIVSCKEKYMQIKENVKVLAKQRLWTWDERLAAEVREVEGLIGSLY